MNKVAFCGVAGLAVALTVSACGGASEYQVRGRQGRAPGADATIRVEATEHGTYLVRLAAEHLVPPERISKTGRVYVLWFELPNQHPTNEGALRYNPDDRKGTMFATVTRRPFTLTITVESSATVTTPSEHVVFEKKVPAM